MAYIGKGIYKGASWEAKPIGIREKLCLGSWVFPYFVGERVEFIFEVTPTESTKLKDFLLYVSYADMGIKIPLEEPRKLPDSTNSMEQRGAIISGERTIEYWIGDPNKIDSQLVFSARGMFNDKLIIDILLGIFLAVVGFILGLKAN